MLIIARLTSSLGLPMVGSIQLRGRIKVPAMIKNTDDGVSSWSGDGVRGWNDKLER
jgi:hypothetical protein